MADETLIRQMITDVGAENVAELFGQFQKDVKERLISLEVLINEQGDTAKMRLHAHSLKGLCNTYGAPEGAAAALALEQACVAANRDDIARCFEVARKSVAHMADEAENTAARLVKSAS